MKKWAELLILYAVGRNWSIECEREDCGCVGYWVVLGVCVCGGRYLARVKSALREFSFGYAKKVLMGIGYFNKLLRKYI